MARGLGREAADGSVPSGRPSPQPSPRLRGEGEEEGRPYVHDLDRNSVFNLKGFAGSFGTGFFCCVGNLWRQQ